MTGQLSEQIVINGQNFAIANRPFIYAKHQRILTLSQDEALADPNMPIYIFSTCCYRGYVGFWEIKDDKLYLNRVMGKFKLQGDESLFADWLAEELHVNISDERELLITVSLGVVTEIVEVDRELKQVSQPLVVPSGSQSIFRRVLNAIIIGPVRIVWRLLTFWW